MYSLRMSFWRVPEIFRDALALGGGDVEASRWRRGVDGHRV
jgi:hypothetical protein